MGVAADAALGAVDEGAALADVVIAAADEGLVELEAGPRSTPHLVETRGGRRHGAGFLLVLDVLAGVITGEPLPAAPTEPAEPTRVGAAGGFVTYRVRCSVEPHDGCGLESADWLESTWHELGRLVEFDGVSTPWRAELLTVVPGAAIEAIAGRRTPTGAARRARRRRWLTARRPPRTRGRSRCPSSPRWTSAACVGSGHAS